MKALLFLALAACAEPKQDGRLYDVAFGTVYCAALAHRDCGVDLFRCSDGHTYHCMVNVRERGE